MTSGALFAAVCPCESHLPFPASSAALPSQSAFAQQAQLSAFSLQPIAFFSLAYLQSSPSPPSAACSALSMSDAFAVLPLCPVTTHDSRLTGVRLAHLYPPKATGYAASLPAVSKSVDAAAFALLSLHSSGASSVTLDSIWICTAISVWQWHTILGHHHSLSGTRVRGVQTFLRVLFHMP